MTKEKRVLLVDDDEQILTLLSYYLQKEGIAASCAGSGRDAMERFFEHPISLLVTDLHMPDMTGLELARQIREIAPQLPILICTGNPSPELEILAIEAGASKLLLKPFVLDEIISFARQQQIIPLAPFAQVRPTIN